MALEPSIVKMEVHPGMRYLLCSDGLTDMLSDGEIADILTRELPVQETVELLLERALKKGGRDNATMVLCEIREPERPRFHKIAGQDAQRDEVMKMKNRMQDLDFEQTVAFDRVEDFEFTEKQFSVFVRW
mgnify:CR=1 FL=1